MDLGTGTCTTHRCARNRGADCALVSRGYTALQVAAGNGHDSTVELLVQRQGGHRSRELEWPGALGKPQAPPRQHCAA